MCTCYPSWGCYQGQGQLNRTTICKGGQFIILFFDPLIHEPIYMKISLNVNIMKI